MVLGIKYNLDLTYTKELYHYDSGINNHIFLLFRYIFLREKYIYSNNQI